MPLPISQRIAEYFMIKALIIASLYWSAAGAPPSIPVATPAGSHPIAVQSAPIMEQQFIEKINAERTRRGLGALTTDPILMRAATDHSREMCALNYLDHHSPTPGMTTPMKRYLKTLTDMGADAPGALTVGENIEYCRVPNNQYTADFGHKVFMNSPEHRTNLLQPIYTKVGVSVCRNAKGEVWVTEMFLRDEK
jgi:uncharacterized protein YkwD